MGIKVEVINQSGTTMLILSQKCMHCVSHSQQPIKVYGTIQLVR